MNRPVPEDVEPQVRYHLADGSTRPPEHVSDDADVHLAELRYPCPRCDHPNIAAVTPPLTSGARDTCDHCDTTYSLTSTRHVWWMPLPAIEVPVDNLEKAAARLHHRRQARIAGQHAPQSLDRTGTLATIGGFALMAALIVAAGVAITASILLFDLSIWEFFGVYIGGMLAAVLAATAAFDRVEAYVRDLYARYTTDAAAESAIAYPDDASHGHDVAAGDASLADLDPACLAGEQDSDVDRERVLERA